MVGTAALLGSAAIGAGGSILSGILGNSAAKKAAQQQAQAQQRIFDQTTGVVKAGQEDVGSATADANDILSRSAETQLGMWSPYTTAGQGALTSLQDLAGANGPLSQQFSFNPSDLSSDPGYQFTLQQGQQALQRAQAAKGNLFSGSTLKGLASYTTGTAQQYFNDAYQRAANTFNINRQGALSRINTLQGLAGMGLTGTAAGSGVVSSTSGQQAANSFNAGAQKANLGMGGLGIEANAISGKGNAEAAGTVGSANAITNAISSGSRAINDFLLYRGLTGGGGQGSPSGPSVPIPEVLGSAATGAPPVQYWPGTNIPR